MQQDNGLYFPLPRAGAEAPPTRIGLRVDAHNWLTLLHHQRRLREAAREPRA
ncbi:hypothetical protein ACN2MM_01825 [Alkalilimnicola ehrlichii MLHE-1]|uniref:hypothetical protein n=1 Tax=Alkalilimnicola ehrlichii TaxID=351052 RepID=UPI0012E9E4D9|nr:hypothetical protein [Alkalilimnicola ehrlichii]